MVSLLDQMETNVIAQFVVHPSSSACRNQVFAAMKANVANYSPAQRRVRVIQQKGIRCAAMLSCHWFTLPRTRRPNRRTPITADVRKLERGALRWDLQQHFDVFEARGRLTHCSPLSWDQIPNGRITLIAESKLPDAFRT
jgi:hypothetical protein